MPKNSNNRHICFAIGFVRIYCCLMIIKLIAIQVPQTSLSVYISSMVVQLCKKRVQISVSILSNAPIASENVCHAMTRVSRCKCRQTFAVTYWLRKTKKFCPSWKCLLASAKVFRHKFDWSIRVLGARLD